MSLLGKGVKIRNFVGSFGSDFDSKSDVILGTFDDDVFGLRFEQRKKNSESVTLTYIVLTLILRSKPICQ
jgi:hypothetical protein